MQPTNVVMFAEVAHESSLHKDSEAPATPLTIDELSMVGGGEALVITD